MKRTASLFFAAMVCTVASMTIVSLTTSVTKSDASDNAEPDQTDWKQGALFQPAGKMISSVQNQGFASETITPTKCFEVEIRRPGGPPRVELAGADPQGRAGSVACSTCHSVRKPNVDNRTAATLDEFHQGLQFNHGTIACYSCHHSQNTDSLRMADGTQIDFADVMTLCSQCHSKQAESFAHGAHGGMNGFWDLSRGPQTKNNCIDCHDPHAPAFPKMIVDFKPRDRFNEPVVHDHGETTHE
ncbi:hypothetical protein [Rubripirellula reticaptiva]|uniref:Doubled CXXCH motif n=1 Tax=Rubripirellula reticaptiva TaxID=2528013 RepID=A0A5C6EAZ6_9BACT|nr:hypothetical protein [Rubripirellula reticaptiva]TWU46913.1 Doubled CXXCH motif [Rubripirellula reticaptiva]